MGLTSNIVRSDALRSTEDGVEVRVHLPWFRSLPLSCIGDIVLEVDGSVIAADELRVRLGDREWDLGDLADLDATEWFVLDELALRGPTERPIEPGSVVNVGLVMEIRIPDLLIGPDTVLTYHHHVEKHLTAA